MQWDFNILLMGWLLIYPKIFSCGISVLNVLEIVSQMKEPYKPQQDIYAYLLFNMSKRLETYHIH